jgi:hypothetical protein
MALLKEFFMWCTVLNLGLYIFTAIMSLGARGFIHRIHGRMFDLNENTINTMLYGFLAFYKIIFFVFCLFPWIALVIMA